MTLVGMTKSAVSVHPDTSVQDALKILVENRLGAIPVVESEANKVLVGFFSDRDVLKKIIMKNLSPAKYTVSQVMCTDVLKVPVELTPEEALKVMESNSIRRLPVVDKENRFVGTLSLRDLLEYRVGKLNNEISGMSAFIMADGPGG